jgi:phosphoribosylamine--glycine ligase
VDYLGIAPSLQEAVAHYTKEGIDEPTINQDEAGGVMIEKYELGVNPAFRTFYEPMGMREFMEKLDGNYVVKADGLMGGKGVKVSGEHLKSLDEGLAYAEECLIAAGKVVIEEKLIGQEFSLMSFADGVSTGVMPAIQDHKRAFEADFGPNTGGMGTYSYPDHSLPFLRLSEVQDAAEITQRLMKVLEEETGVQYKGIMYGGFIATKNGVKVIEYNARFGDPEALNALSLLNTNFVQVCDAIWNGDLGSLALDFAHKATVCKYVVPEGYPDEPRSGERIEIHELPTGVKLYFGNVDQKEDGLYLGSSRAVGLVGVADTIEEAEQLAEVGCGSVKGPVFHRKDIGTQPLIQKRVEMMKQIRG